MTSLLDALGAAKEGQEPLPIDARIWAIRELLKIWQMHAEYEAALRARAAHDSTEER